MRAEPSASELRRYLPPRGFQRGLPRQTAERAGPRQVGGTFQNSVQFSVANAAQALPVTLWVYSCRHAAAPPPRTGASSSELLE